jgi:predicted Fe-S protein YdhL (DUF1289 family)
MPVSSPCIKVCVVDPARRLCRGCGRTLDEIARWSAMDEAERRHVMALLADRLRLMRREGATA